MNDNVNAALAPILEKLAALEATNARFLKEYKFKLYNLDEDNVPRLKEQSRLISENGAAISTVQQSVEGNSANITLLAEYTALDTVVSVDSAADKSGWDTSKVYYDTSDGKYYYYSGSAWAVTAYPATAGIASSLSSVQTTADAASASAALLAEYTGRNDVINATSTSQFTDNSKIYYYGGQYYYHNGSAWTTTDTPITALVSKYTASVATTANAASSSVSAIVSSIGSNGVVNAASIVAKINAAASSVAISADHISLTGKTIALTSDNINIASTYFNVSTAGAVTASSLALSGSASSINIQGTSYDSSKIHLTNSSDIGMYTDIRPDGMLADRSGTAETALYQYNGLFIANTYGSGNHVRANAGEIVIFSGNTNVITASSHSTGIGAPFVNIFGTLSVTGAKSRVEQTEHYGNRLLYAYETPVPYYGDIGRGTVGADGMCYVWLDPVFAECIDNNFDYYVFLQVEGGGSCAVTTRNADCFIVSGTPGTVFAWRLEVPQKGYTVTRNEEFVMPETELPDVRPEENAVYDTIAEQTVNEFNSQIFN